MAETTEQPAVLKSRERRPYIRQLLREFGTSLKLAAAGMLALSANEAFASAEAADRLPIAVTLLLVLLGVMLACIGNLLSAEAER